MDPSSSGVAVSINSERRGRVSLAIWLERVLVRWRLPPPTWHHPSMCRHNSDFFRPPAPTESKNIFPTDVHIPNHVQIWDNNRTWCIIDSVASPARKVIIEWETVYWSRPVLISGTTGWDPRSLFTGWDSDLNIRLHDSSAGVVSSSPDALHMLLQTTCQKVG